MSINHKINVTFAYRNVRSQKQLSDHKFDDISNLNNGMSRQVTNKLMFLICDLLSRCCRGQTLDEAQTSKRY